jgi:hypothetical protein
VLTAGSRDSSIVNLIMVNGRKSHRPGLVIQQIEQYLCPERLASMQGMIMSAPLRPARARFPSNRFTKTVTPGISSKQQRKNGLRQKLSNRSECGVGMPYK